MDKGIVIFAYDTEYSYTKIAEANAKQIKQLTDISITLITDTLVNSKYFDSVIITDTPDSSVRLDQAVKTTTWKNHNRCNAYTLSPYDRTLLIDADYFIHNPNTFKLFESNQDIAVARTFIDYVSGHAVDKKWLSEFGIANCWATLLYFRKTEFAEQVFSRVEYIRDHWAYYQTLYRFNNIFRNDYAFALALHELSAGKQTTEFDHSYPIRNVHAGHLMFHEKDILITDDLAVMMGRDNVHIMNKLMAEEYANRILNG